MNLDFFIYFLKSKLLKNYKSNDSFSYYEIIYDRKMLLLLTKKKNNYNINNLVNNIKILRNIFWNDNIFKIPYIHYKNSNNLIISNIQNSIDFKDHPDKAFILNSFYYLFHKLLEYNLLIYTMDLSNFKFNTKEILIVSIEKIVIIDKCTKNKIDRILNFKESNIDIPSLKLIFELRTKYLLNNKKENIQTKLFCFDNLEF